jgi:uncharacterized pyridoxamine 5'-phosphate oxidase family protein
MSPVNQVTKKPSSDIKWNGIGKQDFVSFFKENPVCYLATADNGKPSVRPVQLMFESEGKLYFCTANTKNMYKQMKNRPICGASGFVKGYVTTLRINGEVKFSNDFSIKERVIKENALVRSIYKTPDNPVFEIFYIEHGNATFQYINGQPAKVTMF